MLAVEGMARRDLDHLPSSDPVQIPFPFFSAPSEQHVQAFARVEFLDGRRKSAEQKASPLALRGCAYMRNDVAAAKRDLSYGGKC